MDQSEPNYHDSRNIFERKIHLCGGQAIRKLHQDTFSVRHKMLSKKGIEMPILKRYLKGMQCFQQLIYCSQIKKDKRESHYSYSNFHLLVPTGNLVDTMRLEKRGCIGNNGRLSETKVLYTSNYI